MKINFDKKDLILIIIVIFLIIVNLILYQKRILKVNLDEKTDKQIATLVKTDPVGKKKENKPEALPRTDEDTVKYLSGLNERDRMEYYCGKYLSYLENKDYEAAYNLLYVEFKKNYFPKYEDFEEYVKKTYPEEWAVEYDDITRQGTIYVLRLKIIDVFGSKEDEKKIQRIVIQENDYNDFVLSFQVI